MRPVSVSIHAMQRDRMGDETHIDTFADGTYAEKDGVIYILYKEESMNQGRRELTQTTIKIYPDQHVVIVRKGAINSRHVYCIGHEHESEYATEVGTFVIKVKTDDMVCDIKNGNGTLFIAYDVHFANHWQLYNKLQITVKEVTADGYEGTIKSRH